MYNYFVDKIECNTEIKEQPLTHVFYRGYCKIYSSASWACTREMQDNKRSHIPSGLQVSIKTINHMSSQIFVLFNHLFHRESWPEPHQHIHVCWWHKKCGADQTSTVREHSHIPQLPIHTHTGWGQTCDAQKQRMVEVRLYSRYITLTLGFVIHNKHRKQWLKIALWQRSL